MVNVLCCFQGTASNDVPSTAKGTTKADKIFSNVEDKAHPSFTLGILAEPAETKSSQILEKNGSRQVARSALSFKETVAVQSTLNRVSSLLQKVVEERDDNRSALHMLKSALNLIVSDSSAAFGSVTLISDSHDCSMIVSVVGLPDQLGHLQRLQPMEKGGNNVPDILLNKQTGYFSWTADEKKKKPKDWKALAKLAGLQMLSAVPIKFGEKVVGLLTLGFQEIAEEQSEQGVWPTYCQLVAATLSSMLKDTAVAKYLAVLRSLHHASSLNDVVHLTLKDIKNVIGHPNAQHLWFRISLVSISKTAATMFDDISQVPQALLWKPHNSLLSTASSFKASHKDLALDEEATVIRTGVALKNTIMKIAIRQKQQVLVPDVQRLMNQSGNASTDIFHTSLMKPPTSLLVIPLRQKSVTFGTLYAMSSVKTDFADISYKLRDLCHVVGPHLLHLLMTNFAVEYREVQTLVISEEGQATNPGLDSSLLMLDRVGSVGDLSRSNSLNISVTRRSSTGALVTGLTEKLNQKRIRSSLAANSINQPPADTLADLELISLIGEGGFAKVFRGSWQGLIVAAKVISDEGRNDRMVVKNAHELAILTAISHPNIIQAYTCLTDVRVLDVVEICTDGQHGNLLNAGMIGDSNAMADKHCHIEILEFCDLGSLASAIKRKTLLNQDALLAFPGPENMSPQQRVELTNMRAVVLTLLEISSALAYLHNMGIVHCDIKPANVLLKTSATDQRGYTCKVSDFGLSRVEDDCESFPFNSCGTAAYVAPEALMMNKKVDSSVDVYAFGIMMWEILVGRAPYSNMKQQQIVKEVVNGMRPTFPPSTTQEYMNLAVDCWKADPATRPTFADAVLVLRGILRTIDGKDARRAPSGLPRTELRVR